MGYRGKLIVLDTCIEFPEYLAKKYEGDYYIGKSESCGNYINISSKNEEKEHFDILLDLHNLLKESIQVVYAVILWDDGRVYRYNLNNFIIEVFPHND